MESTFIYCLIDPRNNEVLYVGKSNNPKSRYSRHLKNAENPKTHCYCWINSLLSLGLKPELKILEEVSIEEWGIKEDYWISQFDNLTNLLDGGKFCPMLVPEIVEKYKQTLKDNPRKFSEKTREKLRLHALSLWEKGIFKPRKNFTDKEKLLRSSNQKEYYLNNKEKFKNFLEKAKESNLKRKIMIGKYDKNLNLIDTFYSQKDLIERTEPRYLNGVRRASVNKTMYKDFYWKWCLQLENLPEVLII